MPKAKVEGNGHEAAPPPVDGAESEALADRLFVGKDLGGEGAIDDGDTGGAWGHRHR